MPILLVAGEVLNRDFQAIKSIARDLASLDPSLVIEEKGMPEVQWLAYKDKKKETYKGKAFENPSASLVFHSVLGYIGGLGELLQWANEFYGYRDPRKSDNFGALQKAFEDMGVEEADEHVRKSENTFCYLEFGVGGAASSELEGAKVIVELFSKKLPKTCENFRALCTGEKGESKGGTKLHYAGTPVHRIVADGWVQMGDIASGKGDGGESIYGKTFADESYMFKHDAPGTLAMANTGPHSNGSQFYVTLREMPAFDNKKVVFGRVLRGLRFLTLMSHLNAHNQRPAFGNPIVLKGCGEYVPADKEEELGDGTGTVDKVALPAVVTVMGLDGAGKSTVVTNFTGKVDEACKPTLGLEKTSHEAGGLQLRLQGLGGSKNIRGYWQHYFAQSHAFVFVVDGSDAARLNEVKAAFKTLASDYRVVRKPILILSNKQDASDSALAASELAFALKADVDKYFVSVRPAVALPSKTSDQQIDPQITDGFQWLTKTIKEQYEALDKRVKKDVKEADEEKAREKMRKQLAVDV